MRLKVKYILLLAATTVLLLTLVYHNAFQHEHDDDISSELKRRERYLLERVTRDPNRVIHYNYPITNNASVSRDPIDISQEMPPWQDVDKHIVVVSGFDQHKVYLGLGMIASVQAHMPVKKIIIYNLGINPKIVKMMSQMCNVEVRTFNFSSYPKHVAKLGNGAWKVYALREVLQEYGGFFYASPQLRFRAPINFLIPYLQKHDGIVAMTIPSNLTVDVSHPDIYHFFSTSQERFTAAHPNASVASQHMWLMVNGSVAREKIWNPMMMCAREWRCIGPYGSTWNDIPSVNETEKYHTHRFDTSVLSLLLYRHYYHAWCTDEDLNAMVRRVVDVVHNLELHDYLWAHYCNPPKKEIDCSIEKKRC